MAMSKAESSFKQRSVAAIRDRDFAAVERSFAQYGHYLELTGEDEPVGKRRFFQYPPPGLRTTLNGRVVELPKPAK